MNTRKYAHTSLTCPNMTVKMQASCVISSQNNYVVTFLLSSKFDSTMQPYFLAPKSYPYAGRKPAKQLHPDYINHVMLNVFSTVHAVNAESDKRDERSRNVDLAWETFMDANRAIICPRLSVSQSGKYGRIIPTVLLLRPVDHSVGSSAARISSANKEFKHARNCTCSPCVLKQDKCSPCKNSI